MAAKGIHCRMAPCPRHDGAHRGIEISRVRCQKTLKRRQPLCHPWAAIEQPGRLAEGCKVDLHRSRPQAFDGAGIKRRRLAIAKEFPLCRPQNPDTQPAGRKTAGPALQAGAG
jgi:hypothetical protein